MKYDFICSLCVAIFLFSGSFVSAMAKDPSDGIIDVLMSQTWNVSERRCAYERVYQFEGILRKGVEDLCETGEAEVFYYLQIDPTVFYDASGEKEEEGAFPSAKVTRIGVWISNANSYVGKRIRVAGTPLYHMASCHVHTDVYMVDAVLVH